MISTVEKRDDLGRGMARNSWTRISGERERIDPLSDLSNPAISSEGLGFDSTQKSRNQLLNEAWGWWDRLRNSKGPIPAQVRLMIREILLDPKANFSNLDDAELAGKGVRASTLEDMFIWDYLQVHPQRKEAYDDVIPTLHDFHLPS